MTEKSTFARRVRAAKPRATKYEVRDDVVIGLALAIQPTGVRSDFLSRMVRGRRRYANIGSADAMTSPEARREARRLIASYIEPAKKDSGPPHAGASDDRLRRGIPRPAGPPMEAPHRGNQQPDRSQGHPARLRRSDRGRHHGRAGPGLVRLHERADGHREPRHAGFCP